MLTNVPLVLFCGVSFRFVLGSPGFQACFLVVDLGAVVDRLSGKGLKIAEQ